MKVIFSDKKEVKRAYMPYIVHGGIMIFSAKKLSMNTQISLEINFVENSDTFHVNSQVIMISFIPEKKLYRYGVQFIDDIHSAVLKKFEHYLLGYHKG